MYNKKQPTAGDKKGAKGTKDLKRILAQYKISSSSSLSSIAKRITKS